MALDFPALPNSGYMDGNYRPLKVRQPVQRGWDVYAVQTGLLACNFDLPQYGADGSYGKETADAVESLQKLRSLVADRIAGGDTMREIARLQAVRVTSAYGLPKGLARGQFERESSMLPSNYSPIRDDLTRDAGIVQRNTQFAPLEDGFHVGRAVLKYGEHVKSYYNKYRSWELGEQRSWELAAGSWNAPAWTDRLAHGEELLPAQREHIDSYIESVTALIRW